MARSYLPRPSPKQEGRAAARDWVRNEEHEVEDRIEGEKQAGKHRRQENREGSAFDERWDLHYPTARPLVKAG
jgi:hypothetical protein